MSDEPTLRSALDQLTHAATNAPGTCWTTTVLATAVVDLERAANASLGAADADPLVVLHRRLGRAPRLLAAEPGSLSLDLVRAHLRALRLPGRTPHPVTADEQSGPALAHAC